MSRAERQFSGERRGSTLTRRWSLNASVRKAALAEDHAIALGHFKAAIAKAGLHIPPALLVNGDLDATLLRFLRARKWSIEAALAMLEKSLAWRARMAADVILEQELDPRLISLVRQCRPSSYIGFDAEHRPIFVERLGRLDGKRFEAEGVADDDVIAYHLREMEFMAQVVFAEASSRAGHTVDQVISVMDADGLTLSLLTGFAQRLFRLITAMDSDNYPECCHAIYIVNGGAAFSAIWRLVSPFVDKGTRAKVHVLGSGKGMQNTMFKELGRERVPSFLGGALDYEAAKQQWYAKMDAAMAERHQHPRGHQAPIMLQLPSSATANGHAHPDLQQQRSSFSGMLHRLSHLGSINTAHSHSHSQRIERRSQDSRRSGGSTDGGGWATPQSAMSRFSVASGASVYFDAVEFDSMACAASHNAHEAAVAAAAAAAAASAGGAGAPRSGGSSLAGDRAAAGAAAAPAGLLVPPCDGSGGVASGGGGGGGGATIPSTPGSLSVGPHSTTRSQVSGFTVGTGQQPQGSAGGGGGAGAASHGSHGHLGSDDYTLGELDERAGAAGSSGGGGGGGHHYDARSGRPEQQDMPVCGCRCVIS